MNPVSLTMFGHVMIAVTILGSPQVMTLLAFILVLFLWIHHKPHHLAQVACFMIVGGMTVWLMKHGFRFPRPTGGLIRESGYGFPSGHTTMSTLFFSLLFFAYVSHIKSRVGRWIFFLVTVVMIASISYSRIYLGVHSWYDVMGGVSLGVLLFVLSMLFYNKLQNKAHQKSGEHIKK